MLLLRVSDKLELPSCLPTNSSFLNCASMSNDTYKQYWPPLTFLSTKAGTETNEVGTASTVVLRVKGQNVTKAKSSSLQNLWHSPFFLWKVWMGVLYDISLCNGICVSVNKKILPLCYIISLAGITTSHLSLGRWQALDWYVWQSQNS